MNLFINRFPEGADAVVNDLVVCAVRERCERSLYNMCNLETRYKADNLLWTSFSTDPSINADL